jgi:hypothetical protein
MVDDPDLEKLFAITREYGVGPQQLIGRERIFANSAP